MDVNIANKKRFLCVTFPGNVVNIEAAMDALGGIRTLMQTFNSSQKRPQLKFRPGDTGCIPVWGSKHQASHMLLHVKKRRHRYTDSKEEHPRDDPSIKFLGIVDTVFHFSTPADFQFIPPGLRGDPISMQPVHNLSTTEIQGDEVLDKKQSLYIPPAVFSNMDKPLNYQYMQRVPSVTLVSRTAPSCSSSNQSRVRRPSNAVMVSFHQKDIPSKPLNGGPRVPPDRIEAGRKLFEERPVWSRVAFQSEMKLGLDAGKSLLTQVAYYFTSGPWARLWVRLGYDPRVESSSYIYQGIDFRLRRRVTELGEVSSIRPRVMRRTVSSRCGGRQSKHKAINALDLDQSGDADLSVDGSQSRAESQPFYIFHPGVFPGHRQFFYQLCDIQVKEVKAMVQEVQLQSECSEKDGWLPSNFIEDVRKILQAKVKALVEEQAEDLSENMQMQEEASSEGESVASTEADTYVV
jgi:general transcription factor 3C polypeptide 5 (transcription factor C subunit 1)